MKSLGEILDNQDSPESVISKLSEAKKPSRSKPDKTSTKKRSSGWIYVISNPAFANDMPIDKATLTLPYKIGFTTKSVEERIKEYRAGVIWDYVIYGSVEVDEDPKTVETKLHKFLQDSHINTLSSGNEWYLVPLAEVKQMLANLGYTGGTWLSEYTLPTDYKEHIVRLHT